MRISSLAMIQSDTLFHLTCKICESGTTERAAV